MGFDRRSAAFAAFLSLTFGGTMSPALAQAPSVTLAWDANAEANVAGYIVYAGNESGRYVEQFDVGAATSFVYVNPIPGRPYYFAVAAYESTRTVGPRSEEVLYLNGLPAARSVQQISAAPPVDALPVPLEDVAADDSRRVVCAADSGCYTADRLAAVRGYVDALQLARDGRVFFIHDAASVRVLDRQGLVPEPALRRDAPHAAFVDLVLDPDFAQNRLAYLAEILTRPDGRRELNIVRYREIGNVLGERAVIVTGLPMSPTGTAALTVDSAHRLYVALPADASRPFDPYQGMVLRFESDGRVPDGNRAGSPVFARGSTEPVSLEWDAAGGQLWLTATAARGTPGPMARFPVDDGVRDASADRMEDVVLIDNLHGVVHIRSRTDPLPVVRAISSNDLGGDATSAAWRDGDLYISLIVDAPQSSPTSQILRLRRD